jgi:membrane peptidoglycan carboxypeptidase
VKPNEIVSLIQRRKARQEHRRRSFRQRAGHAGLGCGAVLGMTLAVLAMGLGAAYASLTANLPSLETLPLLLDRQDGLLLQPTRLYDRTGTQVLRTLENPGVTRRFLAQDPTLPDHFSPTLIHVTISALDPNFWSHSGASIAHMGTDDHDTLAQRLVYDLLLSSEAPGLRRELRERLLATQVTQVYGREQVLEWYLNSAYYGHLAYGAEAAAQAYFGKSASELNLAESALLVGVSQTPALNPLDAPDAARTLEKKVLDALVASGAVSKTDAQTALAAPLRFANTGKPVAQPEPALIQRTLDELSETLGESQVERGGLRVITTMDMKVQQAVNCTLKVQLARLSSPTEEAAGAADCEAARLLPTLNSPTTAPDAAWTASAAVIDPSTGQILALAGDTTLQGESTYASARTAGSLLTPWTALTGFTRGMSPASLVWDLPSEEDESSVLANLDGKYHGPVRLRTALANDQTAAVDTVSAAVGNESVWRIEASFGLPTPASGETDADVRLSPVQAAHAFSVLANKGVMSGQAGKNSTTGLHPTSVLRVESLEGRTLLDASQPAQQPVVSEPLAYLTHSILSDETARWTSLGHPNSLEIGRSAGVKLGRSMDGTGVWTVGYTSRWTIAIWLGAAQKDHLTAAVDWRAPAGIWHALMQYVTQNDPVESWALPVGVSEVDVCDPSGLLPTKACPSVVREVFLTGSEPVGTDTLYRELEINRETGKLATVFTPSELVEKQVYLVVPAEAADWARAQGLPVPPADYDTIQPPAASADVNITSPEMFATLRGKVTFQGTAAGNNFAEYRMQVGQGLNPQAWIQVGEDVTQPVSAGKLAEWDTTGLNGLYAVQLLVVQQDNSIETFTTQVLVDNQPPAAKITYPAQENADHFTVHQRITFQAEASDEEQLARVEWWLDGKPVQTLTEAPFVYPWTAQRGKHTIELRVYDAAGNEFRTPTLTLNIK